MEQSPLLMPNYKTGKKFACNESVRSGISAQVGGKPKLGFAGRMAGLRPKLGFGGDSQIDLIS